MSKLVSYGNDGQGILCGATVVDNYWLLTAAHCALQLQKRSFIYVRKPTTNKEYSFKVVEAYVHAGYNNQTADHDIALLKISFDLSKLGINPVCLVRDDSKLLKDYKNGMVIGYGLTLGEDSLGSPKLLNSQTLQSTSVPIIPDAECVKTWRFLSLLSVKITYNQICAGSYMHGTAPGDSGGPLLIHKSDGEYVQIGITSYGADGLDGVIDQGKFPGELFLFSDWKKTLHIFGSQDNI
ncbi:hypothetical protein GCK72_013719 [Caenorhabditis remanei]|uniref:Peptidase S1 domain-containing protein n=1 Tax=Caenorhabditis remanei TaxID=31234 RepID=A0A6A5GRJ9_CAERE|nr:hypothetical protein GCK72_013719 [Caenorhabditis remanei]KAF1757264.1 hypothetical protein GCK72_013719 [Caenorhabditis remanei]